MITRNMMKELYVLCSCSLLELIQCTVLLITHVINRNKKGINVWQRHSCTSLEQLF